MRFAVVPFLCAAVLAAASANPLVQTFFSEVQTAPDTAEFLEVHPYNWDEFPLDLSGFRIVTQAGTAYVNSGVVLDDSSAYLVLDHSNTTGVFSLGDRSDTLVLLDTRGDSFWTLSWPTEEQGYPMGAWSPEEGMSAAVHQWWSPWPDPFDYYYWYIDSTPTPGAPNDDTIGGIYGNVFRFDSTPIGSVYVYARGPHGSAHGYIYSPGQGFAIHPTGPGVFEVSALRYGYPPGFYPESVRVHVNESRTGINIYINTQGIESRETAKPIGWTMPSVVRGSLFLPERLSATLLDPSGRETARLTPGPNDVSRVAPGVYFVRPEGLSLEGRQPVRRVVVAR